MTPAKILVVDDEPGSLSALMHMLDSSGYQVIGANDGMSALEQLELLQPDLVLTDLQMPGIYRLNVINLRLPPLRERISDIPLLATHFAERFAADDGRPALEFSAPAMALLLSHPWPGNVREMQNVIQRAVVLAEEDKIEPQHLPPEIAPTAPNFDELPTVPTATMLDFESYAILKTLEATQGSTSKTAAALGISVRKIQYRLQEYRSLGACPLTLPRPRVTVSLSAVARRTSASENATPGRG